MKDLSKKEKIIDLRMKKQIWNSYIFTKRQLLLLGIAWAILTIVISSILSVLWIPQQEDRIMYDINEDGVVDIVDVSIQIDALHKTVELAGVDDRMLETISHDGDRKVVDVNADGEVTQADLSIAIMVVDVLMDHFGYMNITEPLPLKPLLQ